jgi:predicted nuclease with TOPRIM domain
LLDAKNLEIQNIKRNFENMQDLKINLESLNNDLCLQFDNLKNDNDDLCKQLAELTSKLQNANEILFEAKESNNSLENKLNELNSEVGRLNNFIINSKLDFNPEGNFNYAKFKRNTFLQNGFSFT